MSKNRKESEDSLKSKGSKTLSPEEYLPELDTDLQVPYNPAPLENLLQPSEKPSKKSKKPAPVVELRKLTPSEIESLREEMNKVGEQVKGRSRHLPKNKKSV
jgi:hypothetical protein